LISEQTQRLLTEIFGDSLSLADAPQIRKRIVRWGNQKEPVELPHRGLVLSEQALLDRLWQHVQLSENASASPSPTSQVEWTIVSASNSDISSEPQPELWSFGSRLALTTIVELDRRAPADCCWIESLPDGWLFLLPAGEGRATLISTGYAPEKLIEQSGWIARQISNVNYIAEQARRFPAFPQLLSPLCGSDWLGCGSAAMIFDPLCGEGAGHAAREAILASAVIRAAAQGYVAEDLLSHYATRLMQGFLRHLQVCLPFYQSGGSSSFWTTEAAELRRGIRWMEDRLQARPPFIYRLSGYDLEPIADGQVQVPH
jgi:hypothetical protein